MGRLLGKVLALRRSMLVQMSLLTVIFVGWGLYSFAVRPLLTMVPVMTQTPVAATAERLRDIMSSFVVERRDNPDYKARIAEDAFIRRVQAANPGFRYYIRIDDEVFATAPSRYYDRLHLDRLERLHRDLRNLKICSETIDLATGKDPGAYAQFNMCNRLTYYEYDGLRTPVLPNSGDMRDFYQKWFWSYGGTFLLTVAGLFVIFAIIITGHMIFIRRIARLAHSFDPRRLDRKLPETGIATEIIPLVRAINHLIGRVDENQRRNTFFLSAAAHEMRTPLTVLRTRLELLDDGTVKDKLVRDVRRLMELVNQLLTLMSIGNRREITGFVDLVACGRAVATDLLPLAAERGVDVRLHHADPILEAPGDRTLIRSAVANLVANAISFSPPGSVVDVSVTTPARVIVRDHGPGLGGVDPDTLFEPFVRFPPSRRGYGLGLAIVRAIVTLHGGVVVGYDADGGGAIFQIDLAA